MKKAPVLSRGAEVPGVLEVFGALINTYLPWESKDSYRVPLKGSRRGPLKGIYRV